MWTVILLSETNNDYRSDQGITGEHLVGCFCGVPTFELPHSITLHLISNKLLLLNNDNIYPSLHVQMPNSCAEALIGGGMTVVMLFLIVLVN